MLRTIGEQHVLDRIELLSGEWRVLFAINKEYAPTVGGPRRLARMMVAPDRLAGLVNGLWRSELHDRWQPLAFGLTTLTLALPLASGLVGVVFVEEEEEWLYATPVNEVSAIRPSIFALIEPHMRELLRQGDFVSLGRLAADHADSIVEFSTTRWLALREACQHRAPAILKILDRRLAGPDEYDGIITALKAIVDPQQQPSLDSWLRVQAGRSKYALYFRDIRVEKVVTPVAMAS